MNRHLLIAIAFSILSCAAYSQTETLKIQQITMPDCINWIDEAPMLLTKKRQLDSLLGDCTRREKPDIDFKRHDLIGFEFMADCKAYFTFELRLDSLNQEYHFVTEERYGGCAGMSRFKHWYLIPKLEKGYQHKYLAMIGKAW